MIRISLANPPFVNTVSEAMLCFAFIALSLLSRKLHSGKPGQLLIQMCLSLIGLYISFLVSALLGNNYGKLEVGREALCIGFSALVHYFFLVYFCTTVAQSVLLYLQLVRVLGNKNLLSRYHLKVGVVAWSKYRRLVS